MVSEAPRRHATPIPRARIRWENVGLWLVVFLALGVYWAYTNARS